MIYLSLRIQYAMQHKSSRVPLELLLQFFVFFFVFSFRAKNFQKTHGTSVPKKLIGGELPAETVSETKALPERDVEGKKARQ